jgi:hypothetical protein
MPPKDHSPSQEHPQRENARPRIRAEQTTEGKQKFQSNEAELNAFANWFADWWLRRGRHCTPDHQDKPQPN